MHDYERQLTTGLSGKLWLLASLFLVLLPHLLRMPVLLAIACITAFGLRLGHELKGWPLPRRYVRWLLTLGAFALVLSLFKTVIGRDAGVALLSVMICLKLLEMRTLRDAMVTIYLGYFLVIGAFLFSQSIYTGGYLLLVVVLLTATLIAINHPHSTTAHSRYYLRYSGRLLLQAFPLMIVMFLLFPRLSGPLWSMPQSGVGKTGLSDQIQMGTVSSLVESEEVAFRVEFDGPIPAADQLYWRGPVLWQTDGRLWQRIRQRPSYQVPAYSTSTATVSYTVTMESSGYNWLFALDLLATMPQGLDSTPIVLNDFQLLSDKPIKDKQRYTISSSLNYRTADITDSEYWAALQLPDETNLRTLALAKAWSEENLSTVQLVQRTLNHFRNNDFYYTREPPLLGENPVDDFLFNTKRGFCEHYATSFVTLMRATGVPARVVTGYQGGESNQLGNYLIVRQSNAHAWAEVWLDESGWTRIDPTTAIPVERVEATVDTQRFATTDLLAGTSGGKQFSLFAKTFFQIRQVWDALNYGWNAWILGFDKEQQARLLKAIGLKDSSMKNLLLTLVATLVALVAAISFAILLKRPRHKDPVLRLYQRFCDRLAKQGTTRMKNEGPKQFAQRAAVAHPQKADTIWAITDHYIALRYGNQNNDRDLATFKLLIHQLR